MLSSLESNHPRLVAVALGILLGACAGGAKAPPTVSDRNREEINHLISSLTIDAPDSERRFSPQLQTALPPPMLRASWHSLCARYGSLRTFSIIDTDNLYAKQRYTVSLDFERSSVKGLFVFEPISGEIVGIFFFAPSPATATSTAAASEANLDPDVEEILLTVGEPARPLGATLAEPRGPFKGRLPAALIVGGSGPIDRDGTMQSARPYRDIAHGLALKHVVTLRFDKRTFMYPHEFVSKAGTVEDEILADAVMALNVLRTRPEVDPRRVFILGHSLGGFLAPEIATRTGDIAGLVLIAAPGRPLYELTLQQLQDRGEKAADLELLKRQIAALSTMPANQIVLGAPAAYWQDLKRRDELEIARTLNIPVIYLRGALDRNVFSTDQERWQRALGGTTHFESVTLPGLDHLLMPAAMDAKDGPHVPDATIAQIATFIAQFSSEAR